jgi:3-dehydroquinate synthase
VWSFDLAFRPSPRPRSRVRIGAGAFEALVDELRAEWPDRLVAIVSDATVAPLWAAPLRDRLAAHGLRAVTLVFPAGEPAKTRDTAAALEDGLYRAGAGRDTLVLAVGGGVTGDLAGYLASVWHRGVPLVQAPTSLLAMVDAAVGGKTGFNLAGAKNLIGTVHQPWGIYADLRALATLPAADYAAGFAEVIKAAAIADAAFLRWLEASAARLVAREPAALERAVVRSVEIKARIVTRDERESGRRAILNFGHTLAHAAEAASGYRLAHGEAVAAGMCLEARLAAALAGFPAAHVRRLEALVAAFGLPTRLPAAAGVEAIVAATHRDKKARAGRVRYALPLRLGRMPAGVEPTLAVEDEAVRRVLAGAAGGDRR